MFRFLMGAYFFVAIALLVTSFLTTRRAKQITGDDHYLFTQTRIVYDRYVPPSNATDAALDEAQRDDGDSEQSMESDSTNGRPGVMTVDEPLFVLGFLDVTGSFIVVGGLAVLSAAIFRHSRRKSGILMRKPRQSPPT